MLVAFPGAPAFAQDTQQQPQAPGNGQAPKTLPPDQLESMVATTTESNKQYITIEPASPEVIYVPQYSPEVVYGAAPAYYPYPPIEYPSTGAIIAGGVISFGAGLAIGSAISGWGGWGGWGWGCGWGG